jgi:hypothetical protein
MEQLSSVHVGLTRPDNVLSQRASPLWHAGRLGVSMPSVTLLLLLLLLLRMLDDSGSIRCWRCRC